MKRFEQMEVRRFEQQVAPRLDTPTGLYPHAAPAHIPTSPIPPVDLSGVGDALKNLGALAAQLGELKREADRETDELAMLDYKAAHERISGEVRREFSELPITEQGEALDSYRLTFEQRLGAEVEKIPMSKELRQKMSRLQSFHFEQFGNVLADQQLHNQAKYISQHYVNDFRAYYDGGNVEMTGKSWDLANAKGINLGMTREQAISGAAANNLALQLPNLPTGVLASDLDEYDRALDKGDDFVEIGDGAKISRKDLARLRDATESQLHKREREETDAFLASVVDGTNEYTRDDLKRMHDDGILSDRQFKAWTSVLEKAEEREMRAAKRGEPTATETGRVAAQKQAALLLRCEMVNFSANEQYRIRQVEEFRKLAVGLFADDPRRLRETLRQIDRISTESSTGKGAFSTPLGQRVKNHLLDTMKNDPYVHSQAAIRGKYGAEYSRLSPEVQEQIMARQYALYDTVKQMVLDGRPYLEIKKVIDEEARSINSAAVEEYLKTPAQSFVYGKTKDGTVWAFDAKTKQPLFPVKSIPQGGNK